MPLETVDSPGKSSREGARISDRDAVWTPGVPSEENAYAHDGSPLTLQPARANRRRTRPRVIDLFSGAGGASVGLSAAGFSVVAGVDHHRPSAQTFTYNHPGAGFVLGDIRNVDPASVAEVGGSEEIEMLVAGIPCQGFSRSNRKRHDGDRRNYLFREFMRFAASFLPPVVLVENVSSIRGAANGAFVEAIREELESLGYKVDVRILNAANFGVPQVRQRLFFLGLREGGEHPWPEPSHGPSTRRPYLTVADAIEDLPPLSAGETVTSYGLSPETKYQKAMRGNQSDLLNHTAPAHPKAVQEKIGQTRPGDPIYPRFRQRIRLTWDRPSPTQLAGGIRPQYQFGHPDQPRGLSVRERCRIQSFPDSYEIRGGLVQGRVQTGNAIPPRLAQAIGRKILKHVFAADFRC